MQNKETEKWKERITIVRAKNTHGALFQPVVYIDNDMCMNTETLYNFISNLITKTREEEREKILGYPLVREIIRRCDERPPMYLEYGNPDEIIIRWERFINQNTK